jgi:P27 family predicted phage terminase small subunit
MSRKAIPLKLTGITTDKSVITIPPGQPKHIVRLFGQILSELNGVNLCFQDTHCILLLAENLDTVQTANKAIAKQGHILTNKTGYVQPNPWIAIRNKAETNAVKLLKQLGMTPAARRATGAKPQSETLDSLDRFLSAG